MTYSWDISQSEAMYHTWLLIQLVMLYTTRRMTNNCSWSTSQVLTDYYHGYNYTNLTQSGITSWVTHDVLPLLARYHDCWQNIMGDPWCYARSGKTSWVTRDVLPLGITSWMASPHVTPEDWTFTQNTGKKQFYSVIIIFLLILIEIYFLNKFLNLLNSLNKTLKSTRKWKQLLENSGKKEILSQKM